MEIHGLKVVIDFRNFFGNLIVNFVGIEYKDANGVSIHWDCFNIIGLKEDSFDKAVGQVSHLVAQTIRCRNTGIPLSNLSQI